MSKTSESRLNELFHSQLDNGAKLTDVPIQSLGEYSQTQFLLLRCQKGDSVAVAQHLKQLHLSSRNYQLVLTEAVQNGLPIENLPLWEWVYPHKKTMQTPHLIQAIINRGEGEAFLSHLRTYARRASVFVKNSVDALRLHPDEGITEIYDIVAEMINAPNYESVLEGWKAERIALATATHPSNQPTLRQKLNTYAKEINLHGHKALNIFSCKTEDVTKPHYVGTYHAVESPEFMEALSKGFHNAYIESLNSASSESLPILLKWVSVVPLLCVDIAENLKCETKIPKTLHTAAKTHPALLKAIDDEFPVRIRNANSQENIVASEVNDIYFELAKSAVTNPNFNWNHLNLQRLTLRQTSDGQYLPPFEEQLEMLIAIAISKDIRIPEHFEKFFAGKHRAKVFSTLPPNNSNPSVSKKIAVHVETKKNFFSKLFH